MKATTERIPVDLIDVHPQQPRKVFDARKLKRLSASMDNPAVGLINPITVRKQGDRFQLLSGERRLRAATDAGWRKIDARIVDANDASALLILLVANQEVEQLNPLERAQAIGHLVAPRAQGGAAMTQAAVAREIGMKPASVANVLRLLRLPDPWKTMLATGKLQETKARLLVSYVDQPEILVAIQKDFEENEWCYRTREDWERQISLVVEQLGAPAAANKAKAGKPARKVARSKKPVTADDVGEVMRAEPEAVAPPARRPAAPEPLTVETARRLLLPYRGRPSDLAAIRDAAAQLLADLSPETIKLPTPRRA